MIYPKVENIVIHKDYIIVPTGKKLSIPVFKNPPGFIFYLKELTFFSTTYYERILNDELLIKEMFFRVADLDNKVIPGIVIKSNGVEVKFNPDLRFNLGLMIVHNPDDLTYIEDIVNDIPDVSDIDPILLNKPQLGFPFKLEVRFEGYLLQK